MSADSTLPEPLPADPMPLFQKWFSEAAARRGLALAALKHGTAGDHSRTTLTDLADFTGAPADVRR